MATEITEANRMNRDAAKKELSRLRNRHVAKLLSFLGEPIQPYLESAIKKTLSQFAEDVEANIINSEADK